MCCSEREQLRKVERHENRFLCVTSPLSWSCPSVAAWSTGWPIAGLEGCGTCSEDRPMNELRWCRRVNPTRAETREANTSHALKITIVIMGVPVFSLNITIGPSLLCIQQSSFMTAIYWKSKMQDFGFITLITFLTLYIWNIILCVSKMITWTHKVWD